MLRRILFGNNGDKEIDVDAVAEAIASGSHIVIDVRELDEWQEAHIEGAIHIPLGELQKRVGEIPADKPVYAMCRSGNRSLYAVNVLDGAGREGSRSLAGGIIAWAQAGKPIVH